MRGGRGRVSQYQIKYRHPRTQVAGLAILQNSAAAKAEKSRLEALGYVVTEILRLDGGDPDAPARSE